MRQIIALLQEKVAIAAHRPALDLGWPLLLHHRYHRREVLAAIGRWGEAKKPPFREGVLRLEADRCELLFITLDKSEERFSSTTRYEDYAISDTLFHWQTQSTVTTESESGRRYIEQAGNGWRFILFVRATIRDAYTYLGPARYEHHEGSRPMSITWRLENSIPGKWLDQFLSLAA